MVEPITIDLRQVARGLGIPLHQVQAVLELLDEGNTIPFITRYRKDQTGGLDEEQLRQIQARLRKLRLLAERKQTILRSIESQGKLTAELERKIRAAGSPKRLEDLYLPYKPKKQTLATQARECGLEPLAEEILAAAPSCANLEARAADFVDPDKKVHTLADALCGAGYIIAERFSERADLRQRLREILAKTGRIVCAEVPDPDAAAAVVSEANRHDSSEGSGEASSSTAGGSAGQSVAGTTESGGAEATASSERNAPSEGQQRPAQSASQDSSPATSSSGQSTSSDSSERSTGCESPADGFSATSGGTGESSSESVPQSDPATGRPQPSASHLAENASTSGDQHHRPNGNHQQPPTGNHRQEAQAENEDVETASENQRQQPANQIGHQPPNQIDQSAQVSDKPDTAAGERSASGQSGPSEDGTHIEAGPSAEATPPAEAAGEQAAGDRQPEASAGASEQAGGAATAEADRDAGAEEPQATAAAGQAGGAGLPSSATEQAAAGPPVPGCSRSSTDQPQAPRPTAAKAAGPVSAPSRQPAKKLSKKELRKQQLRERKRRAFRDYFQYSDQLRKIPPHRVLAINRGERAGILRVKLEYDLEAMRRVSEELCVPADHPHADFLRGCARDALSRLILPSLEREVRRDLTERAETHAVEVFARNLRKLLLQPPVRGRRVLAVDPGFRSGCKIVALDQFGNVLEHGVIYLVGKPQRRAKAKELVCSLISRYGLSVVAIGNGTGCREAEEFFSSLIAEGAIDGEISYVIVNEAGASVYSTSRLGREEFPHYDAAVRGAISIGRRLQDPLSELVKIDPANIGVGLYQHDVRAKHLRASLDEVVESCVNYVGVELNTASPALLRYVSGLNQLTARRICEYRLQHGPFRNRQQLRDVPGVGETTFVQAAGFLKISSGDNPLDATWIHPESYQLAEQVLAKLGFSREDLRSKEKLESLRQKAAEVDPKALADQLGAGELLLRDILSQLARPGRDPREDLPGPVFKRGVLKLEDLKPGMELGGTVLNVVDFGAFVDIGMHQTGLVHVSQLATRFIRDPHDVVSVGDIVRVWVLEVDKQRRRVSLTMIPPGSQRPGRQRRDDRSGKRSGAEVAGAPTEAATERRSRDRRQGRSSQRRQPSAPYRRGRRTPPPPPEPLPEEVLEGKQPMRSFADLAQFYRMRRQAAPSQVAGSAANEAGRGARPSGKQTSADQQQAASNEADEQRTVEHQQHRNAAARPSGPVAAGHFSAGGTALRCI